jgi:hypothetical protein
MDAEIEKWGREHYPYVMSNPKLIESLYRKKVLNQPSMSLQTMAYQLSSISELKADMPVSLIVTKVESSVNTMDVCKECNKRKGCEHNTGRVPFYICRMIAGDQSGIESFERIGTDKAVVDIIEGNELFVVSGVLKVSEKFGREFYIKSIAALTPEQLTAWSKLDDYKEVHGGEGGLSEEEFEFATKANKELLSPIFERVFISHANGRVKW